MLQMDSPIQILIIDDDEDFRDLLKILLELEGFQVWCAPNGVDAITILQRQTVQLIVTELKYSYLDGFQFLKWLKDEANMMTPVLVLTATTKKGLTEHLLEIGASAVLYKPAKDREILNEIEKLITYSNSFSKTKISC